jgi:hypothetical protein
VLNCLWNYKNIIFKAFALGARRLRKNAVRLPTNTTKARYSSAVTSKNTRVQSDT